MNAPTRDPQPMKRTPGAISFLGLLIFLAHGDLTAQTRSTITADNALYSELSKAPAKAAARQNPLQKDPDAVLGGAKLFAQHCAECHGETADGGTGKKQVPASAPKRFSALQPGPSSGS